MNIHDATETAYKNGYKQGMKDAVKWSPVSDPPKTDGRYLTRNEYGMVYDAEYSSFYKGFGEGSELDDGTDFFMLDIGVTHWMPMPQPPKGE